ncbi:MAG: glycosyltransferase [Lachnospiraceae bacterium]|nr:glycosyltransferase [Lachnospiraceae bacterium]
MWEKNVHEANNPFFSILIVCKDGGTGLLETVKSALAQECSDCEILIKDGCSEIPPEKTLSPLLENAAKDSSGYRLSEKSLRIEISPDKGIYEGMNQAARLAKGNFFLFLNCGDTFASPQVLEKIKQQLSQKPDALLCYGDRINGKTGLAESAPSRLTAFSLFRTLPCHQSIFYHKSLFQKRGYDESLRIRGDYEHLLYCVQSNWLLQKNKGDLVVYLGLPVCIYEGGGFSEKPENAALSQKERREICRKYFTQPQRLLFNAYLFLSLQPLRHWLSESKTFGSAYQALKNRIGG